MLERLTSGLDVEPDQVYEIEGPLDLADLHELTVHDRPELKDEPWVPVVSPRFARAKGALVFDEIARADVLVHQPYESFRMSFEAFAEAAAADPDVIAIKTTVYRTSDDSTLVSALIDCAEQGKQSVCLVELKARFDERRNIEWSRAMEQAGVHVVHGFSDLKIHAKMTLVVRREGDALRRYVHIGTGNYNAATARLYEDVGIFTADEAIAADVADLFNHLTGFGQPQRFKKLLVAPFTMRARIVDEIRRVAAAAEAGEPTRIRLKLNQLVDPTIIEELYAASQAGVPIEICARAISMLRAGVPGLSETIRVRSVFGRFLEHSRIYTFETPAASTCYLGSADLMPRNLDGRIEVLTPVENTRVRQELNAVLDSVFSDTTNAWELLPDDSWRRVTAEKGARPHTHQAAMQRRALARARRQADTRGRTG
jgi:polyphosphate kinase